MLDPFSMPKLTATFNKDLLMIGSREVEIIIEGRKKFMERREREIEIMNRISNDNEITFRNLPVNDKDKK